MNWASFKLSVHESTDDIRPGRDDPGAPGRDSTQPRCTLRSSDTWGFAGGGGYELSPGGRGPWGFAWDGGPLLSSFLEKQLGVALRARQCQRLFRRLGFRLRKPRPEVAQANPQMQATVKKTPTTRRKK